MTALKTLVFDCDGVVLDSNRIKTEAFRKTVEGFGKPVADALVEYHLRNGGVSRYRKFEYLLTQILGRASQPGEVDALARAYADIVVGELLACPIAPGLKALRDSTPDMTWMIVSGGDQSELRHVFAARGLDSLFDGGIYGSPDNKDEILSHLVREGLVPECSLYLGDSRYDHVVAARTGLSFVFVHGWTELKDWQSYCLNQGVPVIQYAADLSKFLASRELQ